MIGEERIARRTHYSSRRTSRQEAIRKAHPGSPRRSSAFGRHLEGLGPRAGLIKLADRIENVRGLTAIRDDPEFVRRYLDETRELFRPPWTDRTHAEMAEMLLRDALKRAERAQSPT